MLTHVFVDESKARGLLVAAAVCLAGDVTAYRRAMAGLVLTGNRVHFVKESAPRRHKILATIAGFDLSVRLYQASKSNPTGRRACLNAVVRDAADSAERLVIERDESTLPFDRQVLYQAAREYRCADSLRYDLLAPHEDPLLWIPDAVAWSWAKGGEWRDQVSGYCTLLRV